MPRRCAGQAFSKDAQTREAFQAKARKLLSQVEALNKSERDLVQQGLDLKIVSMLPPGILPTPECRRVPTNTPRPTSSGPQNTTMLEAKAAGASLQFKPPAPATWYSAVVPPAAPPKRKPPPMRPPSPRPLRSTRITRQQSDSSRAPEISAVASSAHVATDEVSPTTARSTRAARRAAKKPSPALKSFSHDTSATAASASTHIGPTTPSPCTDGRPPFKLRQPYARKPTLGARENDHAENCSAAHWRTARKGINSGGPVLPPPRRSASLDPSPISLACYSAADSRAGNNAWASPTTTPVQGHLDTLMPAAHARSPLQDATWTSIQELHPEAIMSPAMLAMCSALDPYRTDEGGVALSPITSGLSPHTLGLADLPSPLTAMPAIMSPLPDVLQSPTVFPCLPITPNKAKDPDMAERYEQGWLGLISSCKSSGDTLASGLRRTICNPAISPGSLQPSADARMINMRDLGTFFSPRNRTGS